MLTKLTEGRKEGLCLLFLFVVLATIFSPTLDQKFEIIDDHAILEHVANYRNDFRFSSLITYLKNVNYLEPDGRFRPGFWFLQELQIWLFKLDEFKWRLAGFIFLLTTGVFFYLTLTKFLPLIPSLLCTLLCFSGTHVAAWLRNLSTESWGMCAYSIGLFILVPSRLKMPVSIIRLGAGVGFLFVAALIKESYIPLLFLTPFFCLFLCPYFGVGSYWLKGSLKNILNCLVLFILAVLLCSYLVILVYAITELGGRYLAFSPKERWFTLFPTTLDLFIKNGWIIPLLIIPYQCAILIESRFRFGILLRSLEKELLFIVTVCIVIWFLPQWVIYGNMIYFLRHYMMPINLFVVFTTVLLLRTIITNFSKPSVKTMYVTMLVFLTLYVGNWANQTYRYARSRKITSHNFHSFINSIVKEKKQHPNSAIVFCSGIGYFELIDSVSTYLRYALEYNEKPYLHILWDEMFTALDNPLILDFKLRAEGQNAAFNPAQTKWDPQQYVIGVYFSGTLEKCPYTKLFDARGFQS